MNCQLTRDLRKQILRGHPWVYQESVSGDASDHASLCRLSDKRGKKLAWAIFDPSSPLRLRILSTAETKPGRSYFENQFSLALNGRQSVIGASTNAFRLFNGEGDGLPGLICDIYADTAVIQFDGPGMQQFWDIQMICDWLVEQLSVKSVIHKSRQSPAEQIFGEAVEVVMVKENNVQFAVNVMHGQKTGFFLDQRENRNYIGQNSKNLSVLNMFSYTGGFSVYSGLGGASGVTSLDLAKPAIDLANKNWQLNALDPSKHFGISENAFDFIESEQKKWDMIIVDPPSMCSSEQAKPAAMKKYIELFAKAGRLLKRDGHLVLSSCSSHISFDDFQYIVDETVSKLRAKAKVFRFSGQACDHPYPNACPEMRYLKFIHTQILL